MNPSSFVKYLLSKWRIYAIGIVASLIFGLLISSGIPKTYTSKIQLAPESSNELSKLGIMGSLASQMGVDVSDQTSDAIVPNLYPTVVNSTKFIVGLCGIMVISKDGKIKTNLYDYCDIYQKETPWGKFFSKKKSSAPLNNQKINPYQLTKRQDDVINSIKDMISCNIDQQTSVITIKATTQDPLISATVVDAVSKQLQSFITSYRTGKARHDLEYTKKLVSEAKEKYKKVQAQYAAYADANEDLQLQSYISKRNDLENEMQLRYNIYTQMLQQQQIAEAKVQERMPVYAVIEPATVPVRKSAPHRMLITLVLMFITIFAITGFYTIKYQYKAV